MNELLVDPREFHNSRFVRSEGLLSFFSAERAVVCVGSYDEEYQICQIGFTSDGSIIVSAPYFRDQDGMLSRATVPDSPPFTLSLRQHGKVTSQKVKYSHHPDGRAHFSQDGKIRTEILAESFPLLTSIGFVFELHVYWPSGGFRPLNPAMRRKNRLYLRNKFRGTLPPALTVIAEWRRKEDLIKSTVPTGSKIGPVSSARHRRRGGETIIQIVGQPESFPMQDHVLMVYCVQTTTVESISRCSMIMLCGWNPHEIMNEGASAPRNECLVWMYPIDSADDLVRALGSIDIVGPYAKMKDSVERDPSNDQDNPET